MTTALTTTGTTAGANQSDERGIKEKLVRMFDELVQIKVITVVGNVTVTLPGEKGSRPAVDTDHAPLNDAIVTIFNLVDGDVTNVVAPALKDDQAMQEFHATQVEKSMAVLPSNIAALVAFGKELIDLLKS